MLLRLFMYSMQHGDTRLRAPYMDTLRVPLRCLPGYPLGVDRACSMQDEGLGGVLVHLPMVTAHGTALRVPLGWYCSSVIHHKHTHLLGLLLGPSCGETSRVSLRCFLGVACRMRVLGITDHLPLVETNQYNQDRFPDHF